MSGDDQDHDEAPGTDPYVHARDFARGLTSRARRSEPKQPKEDEAIAEVNKLRSKLTRAAKKREVRHARIVRYIAGSI
jgi:hypothetical protein